ncbi:Uncharacterized protein dnm_061760 [Desulfonema magnum]|uniref:Uncharacterized protein n=1 Tax=Desulfonema magnum TaxID=45655 RepID=A0A975BS84_9BACT|nr:Uncharacterized protein dnm_061760 [Desulfonema magnum]
MGVNSDLGKLRRIPKGITGFFIRTKSEELIIRFHKCLFCIYTLL